MGIRFAKSGPGRFGDASGRLAISRRVERSSRVIETGSVPYQELINGTTRRSSLQVFGWTTRRSPVHHFENMASAALWQRFQQYFLRYDELDFSIDISRMKFPDDFFGRMRPNIEKAFAAMRELEAGAIANPDEKRMVGHYWLRNPALAPNGEL